ncbi:MAG: SusD/RagB family nutrient-binding outer membrane lipoprotein [Saprospiraceae bacterium]|nr:SusD/RagB family nutrient-binding outer membrane lipoprotein [Saprospiraceae bacterium]
MSVLLLGGCTKDFEEINIDPTSVSDLSSDALFTQVTLATSGGEYEAWRNNLIYNTQFVQQFASLSWEQGDKYLYNEGYNSALWDAYYGNCIKGLTNLIAKTADVPDDVNYRSAARVLKAFAFLRLTDSYGDVPYFEAGKGFTDGIYYPVYDEQQAILTDLIKELSEAGSAFDASKPFKGDVTSYAGNIDLWKKAANSLMLRVAMRMSKKDPGAAEAAASKAVAGGVISSYDESFRVLQLPGAFVNPNSNVLGYFNGGRLELSNNSFKFSETFIELLRSSNDPRLKILSVVRTGDTGSANPGTEDDTEASQKGLPSGSINGSTDDIATYSQLRSAFADADDANILISHGQTLLLMAEAAERGWISGDGEQLFRDGVAASIKQLSLYNPPAGLVDAAAADAFGASVAYGSSTDDKMKAINTQYYIVSLLDGYEAHANWRRSGYPVVTPVNYAGNYSGGEVPRRFQYPASEDGLNKANKDAAVSRLGGPDNWNSRVWWDQ